MPKERHRGRQVSRRLQAFAGAVLAGVFVALMLVFFADRFVDGATLSGLNPGGGGPGFLLLLPPMVAGILGFRLCAPVDAEIRLQSQLALALAAGAVVTATAWGLSLAMLPPDYQSIHALMTSAGLACSVSWTVAATLHPLLRDVAHDPDSSTVPD